jgi:hypothetical protein
MMGAIDQRRYFEAPGICLNRSSDFQSVPADGLGGLATAGVGLAMVGSIAG